MKNRTDKILTGVFLVSMSIYVAIFAACFAERPINPPHWQQLFLLCFHSIPMFCLQLLLCRRAALRWRLLIPLLLLAVPGAVFLNAAGWHILGWYLFLLWCAAPAVGCALAWIFFPAIDRSGGGDHNV